MKNQEQKFIAVFTPENRATEAYNVTMNRWESMPEDLKDSDFHFYSEAALRNKMQELEVINFNIEEAFWAEEL